MWDKRYRRLKAGEIIRQGDEVDNCDGGKDEPEWVVATRCIGEPAPDPNYTSHRQYRRLIEDTVSTESTESPGICDSDAFEAELEAVMAKYGLSAFALAAASSLTDQLVSWVSNDKSVTPVTLLCLSALCTELSTSTRAQALELLETK